MSRLETVITEQQIEAKYAISQWEERCSSLEEEIEKRGAEGEIDYLKTQLSTIQEDISAKQAMLDELTANLQIEKDNVEVLLKDKSTAETVYKEHIDALEAAIQEHVTANEELQDELDAKEDTVAQAEEQIELLTQELVDSSTQSEEVVVQWQGKTKNCTFPFHPIMSYLTVHASF